MEIILSTLYFLFFTLLIYKLRFFRVKGINQKIILLMFLLKIAGAFSVALIYTYYYTDRTTADVFKYFDDAKIVYSSLFSNPEHFFRIITGIGDNSPELDRYYSAMRFWLKPYDYHLFNDNKTIIRLNAGLMPVTLCFYYVHCLIFAFISFTGLMAIYKVFVSFSEQKKYELLFGIFLFPSVIFWTSGVLKESILVFALGLMIFSLFSLKNRFTIKSMLLFLFSIVILLYNKYYVLASLVPCILFITIAGKAKKTDYIKFALVIGFTIIFIVFNEFIYKVFPLFELVSRKQNDFINFAQSLGNVGSLIEMERLNPDILSFIRLFPETFVSAFFRPLPWESKTLMAIPPMFENLILFLFVFLTIRYRDKYFKSKNIILFSLTFVFILFMLSAYTSPVVGALVRYKTPALPFLTGSLILLIDFKRLYTKTQLSGKIRRYFSKIFILR